MADIVTSDKVKQVIEVLLTSVIQNGDNIKDIVNVDALAEDIASKTKTNNGVIVLAYNRLKADYVNKVLTNFLNKKLGNKKVDNNVIEEFKANIVNKLTYITMNDEINEKTLENLKNKKEYAFPSVNTLSREVNAFIKNLFPNEEKQEEKKVGYSARQLCKFGDNLVDLLEKGMIGLGYVQKATFHISREFTQNSFLCPYFDTMKELLESVLSNYRSNQKAKILQHNVICVFVNESKNMHDVGKVLMQNRILKASFNVTMDQIPQIKNVPYNVYSISYQGDVIATVCVSVWFGKTRAILDFKKIGGLLKKYAKTDYAKTTGNSKIS